jgi:hypothetical protein
MTLGMSDETRHSIGASSLDDIVANFAVKSVCIQTAVVFSNNVTQYIQYVAKLPHCGWSATLVGMHHFS